MSNTEKIADWLLRLSCIITHTDVEQVIAYSNRLERYLILNSAVMLSLVFVITSAIWSSALSAILPLWAAIAVGLLLGATVYQLDLGFLASGIRTSWKTFLIRIGISFVFALAAGTLIMLNLADNQIEEKLHAKRIAHNTAIMAEYEMLTPLQQERNIELKAREVALERTRQLNATVQQIERTVTGTQQEMLREESGLNRKGGKGPRYQDAQIRMEEALREAELNRKTIEAQKADIAAIESRIEAIDVSWQEAEAAYPSSITVPTVDRDSKLIPERGGLFLKYALLEELKDDETHGFTIRLFSWLIVAVLMGFDLTFYLGLWKDSDTHPLNRFNRREASE